MPGSEPIRIPITDYDINPEGKVSIVTRDASADYGGNLYQAEPLPIELELKTPDLSGSHTGVFVPCGDTTAPPTPNNYSASIDYGGY